MQLPNGDQAIIDRRKIVDYCLSLAHEDGQHKAHLFASIVGLTFEEADQLLDALRTAAVRKMLCWASSTNTANDFRSILSSPAQGEWPLFGLRGSFGPMKQCLGW
jgi:hypothetical protein